MLYYTGFEGWLLAVIQKLDGSVFQLKEVAAEWNDLAFADAFVIGPTETNLVKLVQRITAADRHISIIILTHPPDFNRVKQAIQFAPFVGKNTLCIAYTESLDMEMAFRNAVLRTRQRRSFSQISQLPGPVTSIAASPVTISHLGTFLEQAPISALLVDDASRIVALNQRAKIQFDAEEQKSYVLQDFFPSYTLPELKLSLGTQKNAPSKIIENKQRFLELHLSEVKNDDGRTLHIVLLNDVTEQKQKEAALTESEALFRFMAEAMPQKVWTADDKGSRNFFNKGWLDYTGRTLEELQGWDWTKVLHPDDKEHNISRWKRSIETGEDFEFEHRLLRKDGEYRWHLVRGVARRDTNGKILMWIGTNTDIHEQKAFAEEMERRVKERTFELEKSNSELEQFVYVTSHDLQEPLRKIRIFNDMVRQNAVGLEPSVQRNLEKISDTALRMTTLLKELLNFTQMSKQEQFEDTDLQQIVSKALVDLELAISEKDAAIYTEGLPIIKAIPVQMHQLFYNLINNALKFSQTGIAPRIFITAKKAEKQTVERFPYLVHEKTYYEIVVRDNGIGFDQQFSEQIFHIFQRLHNRADYSGTGIGLALCRKVVTNHYGAIFAESTKGEGATFFILLPAE